MDSLRFRLMPQIDLLSQKTLEVRETVKDKISSPEAVKLGDTIHRVGITLTGVLPFSTRGIAVNLMLIPVLLPMRLIQSIGPDFTHKMKMYLDHDWNQGISDNYIDLERPSKQELRKQVVSENLCYCSYMYAGFGDGIIEGGGIYGNPISDVNVREVLNKLNQELSNLGFKRDSGGLGYNFYSTETGTMFNLVYDINKKEVIICFMGLSNEQHESFHVNEEEQKEIGNAGMKGAVGDWFGGIPKSSLEAIEIGKIMKKVTEGTEMTPVMVGHSHGGGLAQTGAAANGIKGIVFNSRPMGAGVRRYIGQEKIAENARNITAFSGKKDWLSGIQAVNGLAALFERITGIPVPRTIANNTYQLPSISGGIIENHCDIYASFSQLNNLE